MCAGEGILVRLQAASLTSTRVYAVGEDTQRTDVSSYLGYEQEKDKSTDSYVRAEIIYRGIGNRTNQH